MAGPGSEPLQGQDSQDGATQLTPEPGTQSQAPSLACPPPMSPQPSVGDTTKVPSQVWERPPLSTGSQPDCTSAHQGPQAVWTALPVPSL